ncbi:Molybdopterin synthase sulfur carrier subunit [Lentibacillus sp. JNUCC-1]|uniref:molybdopterin converting factor subunit 1 n=1 Tax=Lentibacillus sp. JNUCC-1 TaxID=2654513 RepID=UPI0012E90074|nr:molybdopterin converting factor subunit 1 [Lentibacillus sp. JNUCC-1]MUV36531.1 Molybdopterin synthase sulfur carrier subunit [Lentibacillus sp. JNUCC-1]
MVNVLFFAGLQEAVGRHEIELDAAGMTVEELKNHVLSTYNINHINHVMVAVNEEYASDNITVQDNDTVAFIPPVSGG